MKVLALSLALGSLCLVAGCGRPVPADKASYIGEWSEKTMYLSITESGSVKYKREKGDGTTSVSAPLKGFRGDNFDVGLGPIATTFVVSKAPYQDGDKWKMVVDGVELVRSSR